MDAAVGESSNAKDPDVVEVEVARGERDDLLDEQQTLRSDRARIRGKPCSRLPSRSAKVDDVSRVTVRAASARIEELARPTRQRVLITLRERTSTLSPAFVDNLTKMLKAEPCLTPEEAARAHRRKKRDRTTKVTRSPPKKRARPMTRVDETTTLDRDAALCQYLMAERLVRNILQQRCRTPSKDLREIAQVILRRLGSLDGFTAARNGDDRAAQQLHLLAEIAACWIVEILVEVAEDRKEALEEYCRKKQMKMMEVDEDDDDDDDDEADGEIEDWKQVEPMKEREEREVEETSEERNDKWKREDVVREAAKREEEGRRKQPDEKEVENKDAENGRVEKERKNEENMKGGEDEEMYRMRDKEEEEEKRNEAG